MDHTARFAAESLRKVYPEPEQIPSGALVVLTGSGKAGLRDGARPSVLFPLSDLHDDPVKRNLQYLGHRGLNPCYGYDLADGAATPEGIRFTGIRELFGVIPDDEIAIAGLAAQIADYDRTTRFCGRCGAATVPSRTERAKTCPACGLVTYARLSPAIIVLVQNGDRILLVRGKNAPAGRYSLVAGFIEPGETIEHAVRREVLEEAGLDVTNVRYMASEPWPFPNSLMLGFVATSSGCDPVPDGVEIESAGWFGKDDLPFIPPRISIARALMDAWLTSDIPPVSR
jgi:NAD+ diphosphatase